LLLKINSTTILEIKNTINSDGGEKLTRRGLDAKMNLPHR